MERVAWAALTVFERHVDAIDARVATEGVLRDVRHHAAGRHAQVVWGFNRFAAWETQAAETRAQALRRAFDNVEHFVGKLRELAGLD